MLTVLICSPGECSHVFLQFTQEKAGKSKVTRRKKQKEETESDTKEQTEADTEEETEADTEEEEDSGTEEEEYYDAEEEGDSNAEEEGDSDAKEEEDSDAEDGGLRRARKRPLEVAEEDYAKPNKWALAQLCVLKHVFECSLQIHLFHFLQEMQGSSKCQCWEDEKER